MAARCARDMTSRLISVVVPVFNEEAAIRPFVARALPALREAVDLLGPGGALEILFVDDGSTDRTLAAISLAMCGAPYIKAVSLSRNFGKDSALAAGLKYASGHAVVVMDVDLQDPPEVIPLLVSRWLAGARVVSGVRTDRSSDRAIKRLTAAAFYRVYNMIADRPLAEGAGDFRLLDRQVVDILNGLPERSRFMKGLFSWVGFEEAFVPYVRQARASGTSKWRYWRLWNFAIDGITAASTAPLRVWTYVGVGIASLSFGYAFLLIAATFLFGKTTPGYASLMAAILCLGGMNLIALGILGEYIGRISNEVKSRPLYVVRATAGFEESRATRGDEWNEPSTTEWRETKQRTGGLRAAGP
jgi:glycosyltransferase involved in cell wall biosynthesis